MGLWCVLHRWRRGVLGTTKMAVVWYTERIDVKQVVLVATENIAIIVSDESV